MPDIKRLFYLFYLCGGHVMDASLYDDLLEGVFVFNKKMEKASFYP
jgi:hypothetical protein